MDTWIELLQQPSLTTSYAAELHLALESRTLIVLRALSQTVV